MKKISIIAAGLLSFSLILFGLITFLSPNANSALPANLEMNCTFDYFKVSNDGQTWTTIMGSPATINLLGSTTTSTSGASVQITAPPAGTYRYLKMGVSAIELKQGSQTKDLLAVMKAQQGAQQGTGGGGPGTTQSGGRGEDWDNIVTKVRPFYYDGSEDMQLNMYFPASNIIGSTMADYFPINGPSFSFVGGSIVLSEVGTISATISSGVTASKVLQLVAFADFKQGGQPVAFTLMTNPGDGTASGNLHVDGGDYVVMAFESSGKGKPQIGDKVFTLGGNDPWATKTPQTTTVATGSAASITLAEALTVTASNSGGTGKLQGSSSMTFSVQASQSAISISGTGDLTIVATKDGDSQFYNLVGSQVTGSFTSKTLNAPNLPAGVYYVMVGLDTDGDYTPDYFGMYGGGQSIQPITLADGDTLDLTLNPIYLNPVQQNP